jgi:hypothetical protein
MLLLLLNAAAVLAMTGVIWFVQLVHYPLFAAVGTSEWDAYHSEHSRRTTWVVALPMTVDLASSLALVVVTPASMGTGLAAAGVVAALVTWGATAGLAVPAHRKLGRSWDDRTGRRLVRANWVRTVAWSAHAVLVLVALAGAT